MVVHFQPISTVELPEFRELILLLKPDINPKDIPGRGKISELAMEEFNRELEELRERLKVNRSHSTLKTK